MNLSLVKEKELLKKISELESELKKVKKQKKYGLVWEDKTEQIVEDCKRNVPILRLKEKKKGIDPVIITDQSKDDNILIEGDNYHALSVLNYTHKGKIDVIYIDPPYNTGNQDFVYDDKYVDIEDSFRHSKWVSFMYYRLNLAKELLRKTGLIFISIDDNEYANLKMLCDHVFGEINFRASITV
jgi:adenine-specific DNA-methyltransferase